MDVYYTIATLKNAEIKGSLIMLAAAAHTY
jgi:hypothetical protein